MSEIQINIPSGTSKRLLTEGKYCDNNIVITAGSDDIIDSEVAIQADLIAQIKDKVSNLPSINSAGTSEDLEALGALCDWMVTSDSESMATVTVINYHPSYYLHCEVYSSYGEYTELVVYPNDSTSVFLGHKLLMEEMIGVDSVRWSANA